MKAKRFLVFTFWSLFFTACGHHQKSRPYLLVESSFENNNPFSEWSNDQHCCDYSLTKSNVRSTDGSFSLRAEVRKDDPMVSGSIRSQLVQDVDEPVTERWYGLNMYLEDWVNDQAGESAFEWHPDKSKGASVASLWFSNGKYLFQFNPGGNNTHSEYIDMGPLLNNQWVSWVMHIKWATDQSGIIQVWQNGKLVIDRKNIRTCSPDGVYFKLGIDKFGWEGQPSTVTKRVIWYDEIRIGDERANYDIVKPSSR